MISLIVGLFSYIRMPALKIFAPTQARCGIWCRSVPGHFGKDSLVGHKNRVGKVGKKNLTILHFSIIIVNREQLRRNPHDWKNLFLSIVKWWRHVDVAGWEYSNQPESTPPPSDLRISRRLWLTTETPGGVFCKNCPLDPPKKTKTFGIWCQAK